MADAIASFREVIQPDVDPAPGCPALRPDTAHELIDALKDGQLLVANSPDAHWLASPGFLHWAPKPSGG